MPRRAYAAERERLRLAVVGVGGRGWQLAKDFAARPDCEIVYLCDVNESLLAARLNSVKEIQKTPPQAVSDFRRALDDDSVDALVVATPDHWHALATVWGCQAKKDVYVEKPISHSPWEGRQMVEAARRYMRIVQVGTQNRSAPYNWEAKQYIEDGKLGRIHLVRVLNQKSWPNAAQVPNSDPPKGLNWEMWSGPAPAEPFNSNLHRGWHHFWQYSGGDIINDGVHQIDLARWLVGKSYPKSVYSIGGRFEGDGVYETPDTQVAVFEFEDLLMNFELTLYTPYMLKTDPGVRNGDMFPYWLQNATRIEIYGSEGLMIVGRHGGGWQVFDRPKSRQPVVAAQEYGRFPDDVHKENFVRSVRDRTTPNPDIEEGHRSTLLCQLANISYRLGGRKLILDIESETIQGDVEANALLKREYRSPWVMPEVV